MRRKNLHVLLLIDNYSVRDSKETFQTLTNTEVLFLPSNTTAKLQPCDAGISAAMKVRYRRFQLERSLDLAEEMETADIYKVDVLSAMQAF